MRKFIVDVPEYSRDKGISLQWENNFTIYVASQLSESVIIRANKEGLVSLARHLLTLAQDEAPVGCHIHYDASDSLEEGSLELILEKI